MKSFKKIDNFNINLRIVESNETVKTMQKLSTISTKIPSITSMAKFKQKNGEKITWKRHETEPAKRRCFSALDEEHLPNGGEYKKG